MPTHSHLGMLTPRLSTEMKPTLWSIVRTIDQIVLQIFIPLGERLLMGNCDLMNSRLSLRLLGEATIELDGRPLADLPSRTAKTLLFYLACQSRPVARETLAELLWDERSPAQALANLRSVLSSLRQSLDDFLLVTRETVAFNHEASYGLDAAAFSHQLTPLLAHQSLTPATVQPFIATLELYRGEFLTGFSGGGGRGFEEWLSLQRERLHRLAHTGLTRLVAYFLTQGQYAEGIPWAQKLLSLDAYDEQARRQMMWLLVRNGQRNGALQVYESGRDLLQAELGVEPTPATRSVYEQIRALTVPPPQRLPPEPTPFVGRVEELAQLHHHLADPACRLLTITGSGGIGKTRLALAAAQQLVHHRPGQFLHGTFFVPLSGIGQGSFLATTIADVCSLSLHGPTEPELQLLAHLKERELLLVLDNVEPLLTEASVLTLLDGILQHAPQVKLLITSREPLNLREELLFDVTGLSYPPENEAVDEAAAATYSALTLFWQTARRVNRHFQPDADEVQVISRICALLEGTPLALELAAAAIRHANSHTIWQAIRHNLDYLETTWHNVPSRHRTLRASYDYSWQRLTPDERVVLSRLTVFQGGFTLAAAQTIAAATPSLLIALQEKSLLRQNSEGRYDMHPLIRQYAAEGLAKDKALEQTTLIEHSHYYLDLLSQQTSLLRSAAQTQAYVLIAQEIDNVRYAWQQAIKQVNLEDLGLATEALYRFYDTRGWFSEGESLFRDTITTLSASVGPPENRSDAAAGLIARLSGRVAWFLYQIGRLTEAQQLAETSLSTFTDLNTPTDQARLLNDLAIYARRLGDYARAKTLFEACLHLRRQLGDEWETARTMSTMANTLRLLGEYAAARELLLDSIIWQRQQGDAIMLANSLNNLGEVARALGDYAEARRCYEENLVLRRQVDDKLGLGTALNNLSSVAHAQRDFAGAKQYAQESLKILRELAGWRYTAYPLSVLARTARDEGDYNRAMAHFREALQITWEMGYLPKTLDILFEVATVWLAMGQRAEAVTWLTLVIHHEKINAETRAAADEFLTEAMGGLSARVLEVAQARGRELTLKALVQQMLRPTGE